MKISETKFYSVTFVVLLLLQNYLPSFRVNIIIQFAVLLLFLFTNRIIVSRGFLRIIIPILIVFFIGFIGMSVHDYNRINILKDIFHFSKPISGLAIGYFFFKKIGNFKIFVQAIVITALLCAVRHFAYLLITGYIFTGSVDAMRIDNKDNFLELFALFFLFFYKKFQNEELFISRRKMQFIKYFILLSCLFYFSRTMLIGAIILLVSIKQYTIITTKSLKIIGGFVLGILLFYTVLFSVKIERNKPGVEAFLYKMKIAPSEIFKSKINREDHTELWDHWRGYEAKRAFELMNGNPMNYVVGCGHGSLVNLKFLAPLGDENGKGMKYISELHNGYMYILYKTGSVGMFFYLYLLYLLYKRIYKNQDMASIFISAIGLFYVFSTLIITGIYNANDTIIFILGAMLFFSKSLNKTSYSVIQNDK